MNERYKQNEIDEETEETRNGSVLLFKNVLSEFVARLQRLGDWFKCFFAMSNKKVVLLFLGGLVSAGVFVGISFTAHIWVLSHNATLKNRRPVHFDTVSVGPIVMKPAIQVPIKLEAPIPTVDQLQAEIKQMHTDLEISNQNMQQAMETIQSHLTVLPSGHDIATLQENLSKPDQEITHTLDTINQSVNQIVAQTAQETWVDPVTVQAYFQLVAVQGFSDGMRAVIDVDGHEMTLSDDEICPACRGWQLDHMDFSTQTAVFKKQVDDKTLFVSLRAN